MSSLNHTSLQIAWCGAAATALMLPFQGFIPTSLIIVPAICGAALAGAELWVATFSDRN